MNQLVDFQIFCVYLTYFSILRAVFLRKNLMLRRFDPQNSNFSHFLPKFDSFFEKSYYGAPETDFSEHTTWFPTFCIRNHSLYSNFWFFWGVLEQSLLNKIDFSRKINSTNAKFDSNRSTGCDLKTRLQKLPKNGRQLNRAELVTYLESTLRFLQQILRDKSILFSKTLL